jgi:hypothetical protein
MINIAKMFFSPITAVIVLSGINWEQLGFDHILTRLRFTPRQIALAKAVVLGRLIEPCSDLATWRWLTERSFLLEFEPESAQVNKNDIYKITDVLLQHKNMLEKTLFTKEQQLFPTQKTLFLYDLTNTYFEGQCLNNEWAAHGVKVHERVGRLKQKYPSIAEYYDIAVETADDKASRVCLV